VLIIRNKPLQGHLSTIFVSRDAQFLGLDCDEHRGMCISVLEDFSAPPEQARKVIVAKADYDTIDVPQQFLEYIGSYIYRLKPGFPVATYHAFFITDATAVRRETMIENNHNERINSDAE